VLDDPSWAGDVSLPPGDEPLVLVALSSTFQDQAACLQRIIDALATMSVRAVVTTGPALDPSTLRAPDHVSVVRSAAHTQLLEHASAIVTHGGHGTVLKALVAGVPLVVLPHGRDQADNGRRVSARGAGIVLRRAAKPRSIERAVRAVLDDPAYRRAAADLGARIRRDAATDRLVEVLEASVPVAC
jgi:MGT family glycosyltransferase